MKKAGLLKPVADAETIEAMELAVSRLLTAKVPSDLYVRRGRDEPAEDVGVEAGEE